MSMTLTKVSMTRLLPPRSFHFQSLLMRVMMYLIARHRISIRILCELILGCCAVLCCRPPLLCSGVEWMVCLLLCCLVRLLLVGFVLAVGCAVLGASIYLCVLLHGCVSQFGSRCNAALARCSASQCTLLRSCPPFLCFQAMLGLMLECPLFQFSHSWWIVACLTFSGATSVFAPLRLLPNTSIR